MEDEPQYPLYRGLQKPLVLFGMKGTNIYWAAGGFIGGAMGMMIGLTFFNIWVGLILLALSIGFAAKEIFRSYQKGLHRKKEYKGIWVVTNLITPTRTRKYGKS